MKYKFRGHETFAIRKGWLSKGLKQVQKNILVKLNVVRGDKIMIFCICYAIYKI